MKKYIKYFPYVICIVLLIVASFYDYQITDFMYHKLIGIDIIFERFMLIPLELMVGITCCMHYYVKKK